MPFSWSNSVVVAGCFTALVLFSGCGTEASTKQTVKASTADLSFPAGISVQNGALTPAGSASAAPLWGTYDGTLQRKLFNGTLVSQGYTLALSETQITWENKVYTVGKMVLDSSGAAGPIHMESYLAVAQGTTSGVPAFSFTSTVQKVTNLSDYYTALNLVMAVPDGTFSPAKSAVFIVDCGFTQVSCSSNTPAPDVRFGTDLRKR